MVPEISSAFSERDFETSLRYEIELKTELSFENQLNLEQTLKNILKYCPANCCLRAEMARVREEYCINLEFIGLPKDATTFVLGQSFEDLLNDLEREALLQATSTHSWQNEGNPLAV